MTFNQKITINTDETDSSHMVKKPTEESKFNDTKQKIIDKMNYYKKNEYDRWSKMNGYDETIPDEEKTDKIVNQLDYMIIHMDENRADDDFILRTLDDNECEHLDDNANRQSGRALSTGCAHAIALYYHCKDTITGIKTYTFRKVKSIPPKDAPYIAGDTKRTELKHYNECKYKIAREIMLQIYANAVSKLSDGLFYVPEIKSFGFIPTENITTDSDTENINEKKYFIKMEHIEGATATVDELLTDKLPQLRNVVTYLHKNFQIQHGDIKSSNIIWNKDIPTLIDWGEATCDDKQLKDWENILGQQSFGSVGSPPGSFGGHIRQKRKTQKNKKRKSQKSKKRKSHKNKKRKSHKKR